MAIVVSKLMNAVQTDRNYNKIGAITERYLVGTSDPAVARNADGIPPDNSPHPTESGYRLDRKATASTGSGHTYVDCVYSNNRSGSFRTVNKDDPTWYHWGWSQRDITISVFLNCRVWVNDPERNLESVPVWELKKTPITEVRIVRPLFVRLISVSNVRWLDPIAEQKNNLHKMPDGRWYRFLGGQVTQKDDTTFDVQYEWEYDPGTPLPEEVFAQGDSSRVQIPANDAEGLFLRKPYTIIIPLPSRDARRFMHETGFLRPYKKDENGWHQLPGANRVV